MGYQELLIGGFLTLAVLPICIGLRKPLFILAAPFLIILGGIVASFLLAVLTAIGGWYIIIL